MDVFDLRAGLIDTYRDYATSFMRIRDDRIRTCVEDALDSGRLWPYPRVGLNPAFKSGGSIKDLVTEGLLHPANRSIFRLHKSSTDAMGKPLSLWRHQAEAIRVAAEDRNYVLTTGTEDMWSDCHPTLADCDPGQRAFVLKVLLDWIRRELGLKVNVLDRQQQEGLKRRAEQRLIGSWSLENERLEFSTEVLTRPKFFRDSREWRYMSARGGFGQFLRRMDGLGSVVPGRRISLDITTELIKQMFERLRRYGLLLQVGGDTEGQERWQIPAAALIWKAGDGTHPYQDHIRMPNAPDDLPTNRYFVDLYRTVGTTLADIEAREHTAQVSYDERLDREERLRSADLPVMYCSPTMELGVDISELNVVNMRNVPPTPANYAQRSGRAGRSGQPALVFTYCAAGSSHDQHFFREPERMISGQVEAPRVDLANEDLIRAHVHAVWLAVSGLNLRQSMGDILDLVDGVTRPELTTEVREHLQDPQSRAKARVRAQVVLDDLAPDLREAPWWSDTWLDDVLRSLPRRFEDALERWRSLYSAALTQAREQTASQCRPRARPGTAARRAGSARKPRTSSTSCGLPRTTAASPTSTPTATSHPRASCRATPSRAFRCPPSYPDAGDGTTSRSTCSGPGSWRSASSVRRPISITRAPATASTG